MNDLKFTVSDLIAGYVTKFDGNETFEIRSPLLNGGLQ